MKTGKNKKIMGAVLAAAILASSVLPVYAADGSQSGTMKLTVSKEAGYILTIPSDQNIVFGTVDTGIGEVSVSGEIGTQQAVQVSAVSRNLSMQKMPATVFPLSFVREMPHLHRKNGGVRR